MSSVPEFLELLATAVRQIPTEPVAVALDGVRSPSPDELKLYGFWKRWGEGDFGAWVINGLVDVSLPVFAERAACFVVMLGEAHVDTGVLRRHGRGEI